jgi:hypothetical protein
MLSFKNFFKNSLGKKEIIHPTKVGERVQVIDKTSPLYGETGTIRSILDVYCVVNHDDGVYAMPYKLTDLKLLNKK